MPMLRNPRERGFTVTMFRREIEEFASRWPCSHLPKAAIRFDFDLNGDLWDINCSRSLKGAEENGSGALSALADDARDYGLKKLGRCLGCRHSTALCICQPVNDQE